jgi:ribosomal-protein-alanine N-acetyltransferase
MNFDPFPNLTTERLYLRAIDMSDAQDIFVLRSNVDAMKHIARPIAKTIDDIKQLIEKIQTMITQNKGIAWGITKREENRIIGTISFHIVDVDNHRATTGYMLLPSMWKQGIVTEGLNAVLQYGFDIMNLHSIEAHIDPANIASKNVLLRCGFVQEASFHENYFYEGKYLNTDVFCLLNKKHKAEV